eukprot:GHUV01058184.1.p1 GENE.GHUV01058184.1~~GHUV01058184.1.p1  ORF type:complete len:124 (-),score=24.92 GHUV01058184.1:113-484(-)
MLLCCFFVFSLHPDEEGDVVDEDEEEEEKTPKTVKQNVTEWEHLNDNKAIWLRKPKDITADEYTNFYKAVSKVCYVITSMLFSLYQHGISPSSRTYPQHLLAVCCFSTALCKNRPSHHRVTTF